MQNKIIDVEGYQTHDQARDRYKFGLIVGGSHKVYYTDSLYMVKDCVRRLKEEKIELHIMVKTGFEFCDGKFIPHFVERTADELQENL